MNKFLTYLKYEGIMATVKKVFSYIRKKESITVFLCYDAPIKSVKKQPILFDFLRQDNLDSFEKIKFFDHIHGRDYIDSSNSFILLAMMNGETVGYIAMELEKNKEIHGLGHFQLDTQEAWVGPVYVKRAYRGKGINKEMLKQALEIAMNKYHIRCIYTSINQENIASLKSFLHAGFQKKGVILCRNGQYTCRLYEEIAHKFSAPAESAK